MKLFILILIAITPGLGVAVFIYIKDKLDPEPVKTLALSFVMGILAFGLSVGLGFFFEGLVSLDRMNLGDQMFRAFFIVAFLEELSKFVFIRGLIFHHRDFDEPLDGIIYSVMIGMGFATAENILYIFYAGGGGNTGVIRMFTAIPAHAFFAIFMGYFIGRAKFSPSTHELLFTMLGLIVSVIFHGFYDYFLFLSFIPKIWIWSFVTLFVAFLISGKLIQLLQRSSPFKSISKNGYKESESEN